MDEKKEEYKELQQKLLAVLPSLQPFEQEILTMRFGLKEKYSTTIEAVEKRFNISKADIRKIELKAISIMRREKTKRKRRLYKSFEKNQKKLSLKNY